MSDQSLIENNSLTGPDGLDRDTWEAMRFAVREALRRHYHQSESFADEAAGEMVNEAYAEYAEKPESWRREVRSLPGVLIYTAIRRGLDKARREGREIYGEGAQAIIANVEDQAPPIEILAERGIEAAEVYEAVSELHREQRQALNLLFWDELSVRETAARMGVSIGTVTNRRDAAMKMLRERLGVEAGDATEKALAKQAGHSAFTIFAVGAGAGQHWPIASAVGDQLAGAAEGARRGVQTLWNGAAGLAGRVKDTAVRILGSGGGQSLGGAVSSGSAGTVTRGLATLGACVVGGAAIYCGAGVIGVGPGVGIVGGSGDQPHAPAPASAKSSTAPQRAPTRTAPPVVVQNEPIPEPRKSSQHTETAKHGSSGNRKYRTDKSGRHYKVSAEMAVRSQSIESAAEPAPTVEEAPPEEATEPYVGEPESGGESSANSAATKQFSLP